MLNFNKYKKALFIFGFLFLLIGVNILSGLLSFFHKFIFVGILNFIVTALLLKINPFKKIGFFLIFSFFVICTPVIVYSLFNGECVPGIISFGIYILSSIFAVLFHYYNGYRKQIVIIYTFLFLFLVYKHDDMLNWYCDLYEDNSIINKELPIIPVHDYFNNKITIKPNGKIQVVDLWSTSCGYCIKAFPEFEKVYNKYKNDPEVEVYAINAKIRDFDLERANKYVKKYAFKNYYADSTILKKLNYSKFPYYMIVGKDGRIKYFGFLNTNSATYNNIYDLIENEKK